MRHLILLLCLFSTACYSQKSDGDVVNAYVRKIDSTSHNYIIHLERNKIKMIVPVFKDCESIQNYFVKIKVGKKYKFILTKEITYAKSEVGFLSQSIDGIEVWNSKMKGILYYVDCMNMCGLFINSQ